MEKEKNTKSLETALITPTNPARETSVDPLSGGLESENVLVSAVDAKALKDIVYPLFKLHNLKKFALVVVKYSKEGTLERFLEKVHTELEQKKLTQHQISIDQLAPNPVSKFIEFKKQGESICSVVYKDKIVKGNISELFSKLDEFRDTYTKKDIRSIFWVSEEGFQLFSNFAPNFLQLRTRLITLDAEEELINEDSNSEKFFVSAPSEHLMSDSDADIEWLTKVINENKKVAVIGHTYRGWSNGVGELLRGCFSKYKSQHIAQGGVYRINCSLENWTTQIASLAEKMWGRAKGSTEEKLLFVAQYLDENPNTTIFYEYVEDISLLNEELSMGLIPLQLGGRIIISILYAAQAKDLQGFQLVQIGSNLTTPYKNLIPLKKPEGFTLRLELKDHKEQITWLAWSPNGEKIASASRDKTIKIWDIATKEPLTLNGHSKDVSSLAWSPDGKRLASGSADNTVEIWDVETSQSTLPLIGHKGEINSVTWSPDGKLLASASEDKNIFLWDVESYQRVRVLECPSPVYRVAWSPDGKILVSGGADGRVTFWNIEQRTKKTTGPNVSDRVFALTWSPKGDRVASGFCTNSVRFLDPITAEALFSLDKFINDLPHGVNNVAFSFDDRLFAYKYFGCTIRLYRSDNWRRIAVLDESIEGTPYSAALAFHPKTHSLATLGNYNKSILIWDLDINFLLDLQPMPSGRITNIEEILEREKANTYFTNRYKEHTEVVSLEQSSEKINESQVTPMKTEKEFINILTLSDIHINTMEDSTQYFAQLKTDLEQNLKINKLHYLVISGDIGNYSLQTEYEAAYDLISQVASHFQCELQNIIVVPGNHDLSYELSEKAYIYCSNRGVPKDLSKDEQIPAGEYGIQKRNNDLYKNRFDNFSKYFYEKIYGIEYPKEYSEQGILYFYPKDKLLFLGLNSSWKIDHHYQDRSEINMTALSKATIKLTSEHNNWVKIAVWHHPVTGPEAMENTDFLQQLAVEGFNIIIHGHIHEALEERYKYDKKRKINIVGLGTFGAPAGQQTTGIPLQYNLLVFNPNTQIITVKSRKKEKPDGDWSADARWEDKNEPLSWYEIELKKD